MKTFLQFLLFVMMSFAFGQDPVKPLTDSVTRMATEKYHQISLRCLKVIPRSFVILISGTHKLLRYQIKSDEPVLIQTK